MLPSDDGQGEDGRILEQVGSAVPSPLRVLVVEDDSIISLDTVGLLQDRGHAAVEATSVEEALAVLRADPNFDLVISDYRLHTLSGGQLATTILETWPDIEVAMLSGYTERPADVPAHVPWLLKPLSLPRLEQLLAGVRRRHTRPLA